MFGVSCALWFPFCKIIIFIFLEGTRRGWAAHLLNLPNARSFMEISRKYRNKRALSLAGCLRVLGGTKESHTSNVQDGKAW